jgi:allophanate hydrolase subunit 2
MPAELRVLPGLYWHRITGKAGKTFFADEWKVAKADRMNYRFRGGRKRFRRPQAAFLVRARTRQHRR